MMEIKGKTCKSVCSAFLGSQYIQYSGTGYAERCLLWIIAKKAKNQFCSSCNFIGVNRLKPGVNLAGIFKSRLDVQVLTSSKTQKS